MIIPLEQFKNTTLAIGHALKGNVAASEDGVQYIRRSGGHRKLGRPTRYYVRYGPELEDYFKITAFSEEEAIVKANAKLAMKGLP